MNERSKNRTLVEPTTVRFEMRMRHSEHFRFMDRFEANIARYPATA